MGDARASVHRSRSADRLAAILIGSGMLAAGSGVALATHCTDISGYPFEAEILSLEDQNITTGCGGGRYCPDDAVPREQMASFLVRAGTRTGGRGTASTMTTDRCTRPTSRRLSLPITSGCGPRLFCPHNPVTREQMASFLVRGYLLDPSNADTFIDDDNSQHEADIEALVASAITSVCGGPTFCPTALVTRGQMAAFLHRSASYLAPNQPPNANNDNVPSPVPASGSIAS